MHMHVTVDSINTTDLFITTIISILGTLLKTLVSLTPLNDLSLNLIISMMRVHFNSGNKFSSVYNRR